MRHRIRALIPTLLIVSFLLILPASAHHLPPGLEEIDEFSDSASFMMGMNHPLTGWDHLLAALLTGSLASRLGLTGKFTLPAAALLAMLTGMLMPPLPVAESMLAASVIAGGGILFFRSAKALQAGAVALVLFQIWHGNAHANEAPLNAARGFFLAGTATATLVSMMLGMVFALLLRQWMPTQEEEAQTV